MQKLRKLHSVVSKGDIEKFNPEEFSYAWLQEEKAVSKPVEQEALRHLEEHEIDEIDLNSELDKLYLGKINK